jgi:hypothetical protein
MSLSELSAARLPVIARYIQSMRVKTPPALLFLALLSLLLAACPGVDGDDGSGTPPAGWERSTSNPLVLPKLTATEMDYGPADPTVLFDSDDDKWKVWFSSSLKDLGTGEEVMTIQYAESTDGTSWSEPVVAFQSSPDPLAWDHTHSETPAVMKNPDPAAPADQKFLLWYSGANEDLAAGQGRPATFPYYQIGLAFSADGKSFTRYLPGLASNPGLVLVADAGLFGASLPGLFGDGVVADPEVIYRDGQFHMWFSSYAETVPDPVEPTGRTFLAFGISHVTSTDGIAWTAGHDNPLASLAKPSEPTSGRQPSVVFNSARNRYEMWFTNDSEAETDSIPCDFNTVVGFWHAVSDDGTTWNPDYSGRSLSYDAAYAYEGLGFLTGVEVVLLDGTYHMFYSAWGTEGIPNPNPYYCPAQGGGYLEALLSLNRATAEAP